MINILSNEKARINPIDRLKELRQMLKSKPLIRILEAHNGITGMIVENTRVINENNVREFDGIWISSLTDSVAKGKPDIQCVDFTSRIQTINEILEVTTKPIVFDGDNGGLIEHFVLKIKTLERLGISAIIIEDKIGHKRNSLISNELNQKQDTIEDFCYKISQGKKAQVSGDFMIIARIESLILKKGLEDALKRAKAYIEAGADGIMIHSNSKSPKEVLDFCREYKKFDNKVPLIVSPSSYNTITEGKIIKSGVNVVIYANHLLRSAYPSMVKTAKSILKNQRAYKAEKYCLPIKDILKLT